MIKFVPASAELGHPIWGPHIRMLVTELVRERMRIGLVTRLTGISSREASATFRAVHSTSPPVGLIPNKGAAFFATANDSAHGQGAHQNLHSTLFLLVLRQLRAAVAEPKAHRAWLLLQAYRAYCEAATRLDERGRMDINLCYGLANLVSEHAPEMAEVALATCPECRAPYIFETAKEPATQRCPLCRLASNARRLASQSGEAARKRWASRTAG